MYQLVLVIHVIVAIVLIALVLLQRGKGANMGAAFGAGASQTVFGSSGAGSFLLRLTTSLAVIFFATSLTLGYIASKHFKQADQVSVPVKIDEESSNPVITQSSPSSETSKKQASKTDLKKSEDRN